MDGKNARPHPPVPDRPTSAEYRVWLDGEEVYVPAILGFAGGTAAFLPFDMDGPVHVRVRAGRNFDTVSVRPASLAIDCVREGNDVVFTLEKPANIFIKWDDGFELPLYLWASEPQADIPGANAPGVIFFPPGVHHAGGIRLESGGHLYLAPGAFVFGYVWAEGSQDIRISGRGVLCASQYPTHNGPRHDMAGFAHCRNVRVEGVVLLDAWGWTLVFRNCDNVLVDGVRILCERTFSTDGINPCNCRGVTIRNCFVRCKDDCVSVKGLDGDYAVPPASKSEWSPIRDILVENCVFWSDNNNCIIVGTETKAETLESVTFRNIDILKASNTCGDVAAAMAVISLHDTEIRGILFEDIRIEHATGPWLAVFFVDSIFGIPGMRCPWGGSIDGVRLNRITLSGGPLRPAYIRGRDEHHTLKNIAISNLTVHGKKITGPGQARICVGGFVENFTLDP